MIGSVAPGTRTSATGFLQLDDVKPLDVSGDGFTEVSRRRLRAGGGRAAQYLLGGRGKLTGEFTLIDESTNGTFVNGERIQGPARLTPGDRLGVGSRGASSH